MLLLAPVINVPKCSSSPSSKVSWLTVKPDLAISVRRPKMTAPIAGASNISPEESLSEHAIADDEGEWKSACLSTLLKATRIIGGRDAAEAQNGREGKVTLVVDQSEERLVKSSERVRDLGEVFTPNATVQGMLDLLPESMWVCHPSPTFLEPACGDGNFLVAILDRKLDRISEDFGEGKLAAGDEADAAQFHALEALASIYAVDISTDNIIGGTPGHEIGARSRLLTTFIDWNHGVLGKRVNERSLILRSAIWIVEHNLIVGNMLPLDIAGNPTGRDLLPLIEYTWNSSDLSVSLSKTTLGDVIASEDAKTATMLSLFEPAEPEQFWRGKAANLSDAERVEAPKLRGPARNGTESR